MFISSISPSKLGQIPKSRTVLKSARSQLSKTVPDFGILPRFDGENEEINMKAFFLGHGAIISHFSLAN